MFSNGVKTNRDAWVYNFSPDALTKNMKRMITNYNGQVFKWTQREIQNTSVDDFVDYDNESISWSRDLKVKLTRGRLTEFSALRLRTSLYRPFSKSNLYFDRVMNDVVSVFPSIFPTPVSKKENLVICVSGLASSKPFQTLMANLIPCFDILEKTQCFPYYTYDEDGSNRRENITDWALAQFRAQYQDASITKWDIFHYVYGLLHHPGYRERYQANLKRELPRIPFAPDFRAFAAAGARLARTPRRLRRAARISPHPSRNARHDARLARRKDAPLQRQERSSATTASSRLTASPAKRSPTVSATAPPSNG